MGNPIRILFVLVLLSVKTALAVDPQRHITELVHRVWDNKSGVPADIMALAQTSDGFLWVASLRGLYRFDGIKFQKFEPTSGQRLASQQIWSVFAASGGRLWIGYRAGGASVLQAGNLTNYGASEGLPEGTFKGFAEDGAGRIWAASTRSLSRFERGRWHTVGNEEGFAGSGAQALLVDHLGWLWVAGEHRIAVLRPHASEFELTDEPYDGQVVALAESPEGTVWMAETTRAVRPVRRPGERTSYEGLTKDECQKRFLATWQTEPRCRRRDDLEVRVGSRDILFDKDGNFWITTLGDGLRRAAYPSRLPKSPIGEFSSTLEQFTSNDGLSSDVLMAIFEDREGSIWVAARDRLDQFRNSALASVTLGRTAGQISIVPDGDGYVVARDNGHMYRFHDAKSKTVATANEDTTLHFAMLYRDPFGSIWGTGMGGGCRLAGSVCGTRLDVPGGNQISWNWRLAVDGNHRMWAFVAKTGLFEFKHGRWEMFSALANASPTTQYTDAAGHVWFGFREGDLLTITEGGVRIYSREDGLAIGEVKAIDSIGDHVWVGGEGGLMLLRNQRFTPVLAYDAPSFSSVSGIATADDGSLWLNDLRGIVRVSPAEVSAILQDSAHLTRYDLLELDGLIGATEQFTSPTAFRGTDGRLWFATTNGAVWVDPEHFKLYRNAVPPPVMIQSLVADGRALSPSEQVELPGGTVNLQIVYTGLSLSVPERVQFRYRLKGLDQDWQSAGTRRTAYYSRLPPGSYNFQVIASNEAGVWSKVGADLPIRIIPAWYKTPWFYAVCVLFVTSAMVALYRLRVAQVRRQAGRLFEARLSERERIARDLHDTLLQSFHGLLLKFQMAYKLLPARPDEAKLGLSTAIEDAFQAITEGRNAVQGLRSSTVGGNDLAAAIKTLGEELAGQDSEHSSKPPRVDVAGTPQTLRPLVWDEIYRIAGESLRNAFRHADAKRIEVDLCYDERQLRLRVRDDGKGVDPRFLREEGQAGHYGIPGMRERAKLLGGILTMWTAPDSGTEVELTIPASLAYAVSPALRRGWFRKFFVARRPVES